MAVGAGQVAEVAQIKLYRAQGVKSGAGWIDPFNDSLKAAVLIDIGFFVGRMWRCCVGHRSVLSEG